MDAKPVARDRFTVFPAAAALLLVGIYFASKYASNHFGRFGDWAIFALLAGFVVAVGSLAICLVRLARRQLRKSVSYAIAIALIVGSFVARHEIFQQIDHLRFRAFHTYYVDKLVSPRDADGVRPVKALLWGFWGYFLSGEYYRILVYDEADEIGDSATLPLRAQHALGQMSRVSVGSCRIGVRRIDGHFYLVEAAC